MKTLCFILALFTSSFIAGQSPYARLDKEFRRLVDEMAIEKEREQQYRHLFDDIPIEKGQEQQFFDYAVKLFQQDDIRKAGPLFDRVYWLDTSSTLATQSLWYRKRIEQTVIVQTQANLNNTWNWKWSGTGWGASDTASRFKRKKIELDGNTIRFYFNDSLIRQTNYILTQRFDWINGFLSNLVQYKDNDEEWHFNLSSFGSFTSDGLWIERKSNIIDGGGEAYGLDKTTVGKSFMK